MAHQHFDLEKIKTACAALKQSLASEAARTDHIGVQARMIFALHLPGMIAVTEEVNRGTDRTDIITGICSAAASIMASITEDPREIADYCADMLYTAMMQGEERPGAPAIMISPETAGHS